MSGGRERIGRRLTAVAGLALLALLAARPRPARADAASRNNEGNRLYEQKRYDEALKLYTDAQAALPQAPELHYNIGNVLFRKGEFDKAIEEYLRAQSKSGKGLSQSAVFNRGNALMMKGQLREAVDSYVQALRMDPADQDAKRNLELALRLLQQQKQQQQQQQPPKDDQQDQQKQQPSQPKPQDEKEPRDRKPPQKAAGQMSEEEARQILDALRENEKDGIRKHAQATAPRNRTPEKDW